MLDQGNVDDGMDSVANGQIQVYIDWRDELKNCERPNILRQEFLGPWVLEFDVNVESKRASARNDLPARSGVSWGFSNELLVANTSFQGFLNGLLARLGSASHPSSSHFIIPASRAASNRPCCPALPTPSHPAGPRFLPLPFGRPTGRLAAAAAAAASCSRCLRACRLASTARSTSARSTSGGGHFSATRFTPKWKRLRCPGGRSGSAPAVSEWFTGPQTSFPAPNIPYCWAKSYLSKE
jgi:hypothetical protein